MERLAIFVEGQTEQIFIHELVCQIAGQNAVHVDNVSAFGGGAAGQRTFTEVIATARPDPTKRFYIIIYNCANDDRVLSDIRDHYHSLTSQDFRLIIGLRDVKPRLPSDIKTIREDFDRYTQNNPKPLLVLAIMEIEAWFIAEATHFQKMHASLTPSVVSAHLGYDPSTFDIEQSPNPADELRNVYMLAHLGYNKSRRHAERTVSVLDYSSIYFEIKNRFSDLQNLVAYLNGFFFRPRILLLPPPR